MIDSLKWLLKAQRKRFGLAQAAGGFTLIELLIAMVLASLVITPLLGFMVNIIESESKEQAKANSEQELQASIDYIAQDLQEAVYIYDGEGINAIKDELPNNGDNTKVPVLVFWKREVIQNAFKYDGQKCTDDDAKAKNCNNSFVYSLVAYYLIKDNDKTWSGAARIGRFQIRDGVQDPNEPFDDQGDPQYIDDNHQPDDGFKLFNLEAEGKTIKDKMNLWEGDEADYEQDTRVLIDFIDQSTSDDVPDPDDIPAFVDCSDELGLDASVNEDTLRVPPSTADTLNTKSFYACVDSSRTLAQVYIRGNALARIVPKNQIASGATYSKNRLAYFPTAKVRLQGRGFLSTQ